MVKSMNSAIVCLLLGILAVAACADTASIVLHPGQNWVSAPLVPFNPDPAAIFAGIDLNNNLTKLDAITGTEVKYDSAHALEFGGILVGEGYVIDNSSETDVTISYEGSPDGLKDPVTGEMTDMWISLPGQMSWIGNPFNHDIWFNSILVTDGCATLDIATAVNRGWLSGTWTTLNGETQQEVTVGLASLNPNDTFLRPGQMYKAQSNRENLAIIVPAAGDVPEPSSVLALFGGLAGISGFAFRRRRM